MHPSDAGGDEDQPRQAGVGGRGAAAGHEAEQGLQPQARPRLLRPAGGTRRAASPRSPSSDSSMHVVLA